MNKVWIIYISLLIVTVVTAHGISNIQLRGNSFFNLGSINNTDDFIININGENKLILNEVNLTTNTNLDISGLQVIRSGPLIFRGDGITGSIRLNLTDGDLLNIDRFENGVWVNKDILGGSLTTNKIFLNEFNPEILLEAPNRFDNLVRRATGEFGVEVGNLFGDTFLTIKDKLIVQKRVGESPVGGIVFGLTNITRFNTTNITFFTITPDFGVIELDAAVNFNVRYQFDQNYTGRIFLRIFDINFSLENPIYESSDFFEFTRGNAGQSEIISQNISQINLSPQLILFSNKLLKQELFFSEPVNIKGGSDDLNDFVPFFAADALFEQNFEIVDGDNFETFSYWINVSTNITELFSSKGSINVNGNASIDLNLDVGQDLNVFGNFFGNQIYGEMFVNESFTVINPGMGIWTNLSMDRGGDLNGVNFSNNELIPSFGGMYKINSKFDYTNGANIEVHTTLAINNIREHTKCIGESRIGTANDIGQLTITCFKRLNKGDTVQLQLININSNNNIVIEVGNFNLLRIGN